MSKVENDKDNNIKSINENNNKDNSKMNNIENNRISETNNKELKIDYDKFVLQSNNEIIEAKFSKVAYFQFKKYDAKNFKLENKLKIKNELGEEEIKEISLENYIRFKNENENSNNIISNARIIEWSDGTFQLVIGDKYFDFLLSNTDCIKCGINTEQGVSIINNEVSKRLLLTGDIDNILSTEESKYKVLTKGTHYDSNIWRKGDFNNSKYPRRKSQNEKNLNKKRKRS